MKTLFYLAVILVIGAWFAITGTHEGEPAKPSIIRELERRDAIIFTLGIAAAAGWMLAAAAIFNN